MFEVENVTLMDCEPMASELVKIRDLNRRGLWTCIPVRYSDAGREALQVAHSSMVDCRTEGSCFPCFLVRLVSVDIFR